eukprot:2638024-Pleurochrysis_carterae.AAC.2
MLMCGEASWKTGSCRGERPVLPCLAFGPSLPNPQPVATGAIQHTQVARKKIFGQVNMQREVVKAVLSAEAWSRLRGCLLKSIASLVTCAYNCANWTKSKARTQTLIFRSERYLNTSSKV